MSAEEVERWLAKRSASAEFDGLPISRAEILERAMRAYRAYRADRAISEVGAPVPGTFTERLDEQRRFFENVAPYLADGLAPELADDQAWRDALGRLSDDEQNALLDLFRGRAIEEFFA